MADINIPSSPSVTLPPDDLIIPVMDDSASPSTYIWSQMSWLTLKTKAIGQNITAKGDILVGTGLNTFTALNVGTDGFLLVADTGESTGLKWNDPKLVSYEFLQLEANAAPPAGNNILVADNVDNIYFRGNGGLIGQPLNTSLTTKGDLETFSTVKTRLGVGADGQVLTADSAEITGLKWATGGGATPLTTKGDILGYDTAANRIPVGTNGQILTADSAQALGVKWGNAPSGTVPTPTGIGDILYSADGATYTTLAAGTNGQVLTLAAGIPSWATGGGGATTFVALTDTPGTITARTLQVGNSGGTALVNNTSADTIKEIFLQIQSPPVISAEGQIVYDGITDRFQGAIAGPTGKSFAFTDDFNGVTLTSAGAGTLFLADDGTYKAGGGASPLTTKGDLYTFSTVDARLPVALDGAILQTASGQTTGLNWKTSGGKGELLVGQASGAYLALPVGTDGQVLTADSGDSDGVSWQTPTGVSDFTSLTDTPSSYTGQGGKPVAVNAGATALEFVDTFTELDAIDFTTGGSITGANKFYGNVSGVFHNDNANTAHIIPLCETITPVTIQTSGGGTNFLADDGTYKAAGGGATIITKTSDETVNNSNTFQDDDQLTVSLDASSIYQYELMLRGEQASASPSFKARFTFPSGATNSFQSYYQSSSAITFYSMSYNGTFGVIQDGTPWGYVGSNMVARSWGTITTSSAGTLTLQWAQTSATAADTKVLSGSYLKINKVS